MTLLAPLMLVGLLGLGLPFLAHLLGRERPRTVAFAAVRFLRAGEPVVTQRRRLHDRALLAIRALLLALLVLMLAHPVSLGTRSLAVLSEPHDAVILVDASMSMELNVDDTTMMQRAVDITESVLGALPPGSRVGLLTSDPRGPKVSPSAAWDRASEELETWLDRAPPLAGAWILGDRVEAAVALLGADTGRPRVIYAIGDRTPSGLASLPPSVSEEIAVVPLPVRGRLDDAVFPENPEHVGLVEVGWSPAPEIDQRAVRVRARLRRFGGADDTLLSVRVQLVVDGDSTPGEVDIEPDGQREIEFTHTLLTDEGATPARVEIVGRDDALPGDDIRHFWISSQDQLEVMIINGDPSELRAHDEVFFLSTALKAGANPARMKLSSIAPEQLEQSLREQGRSMLADTDLLVLANVRAPQADVAPVIVDRVGEGMGLWITVGDRVAAREYNQRLAEVLPLLFRGPVYAGTAPGRTLARTEGFAPVQLSHPIFEGLRGELGLASTQARRLFLLEPDAERSVQAALRFTSGAPALLTGRYGEGRVGLLTTTIDRGWSDLPLRPGFLPLVQRTVAYLGGMNATRADSMLRVGDVKQVRSGDSVAIQTPDGLEVRLSTDADGVAHFTDTWSLGHYRSLRGSGEQRRGEVFAVETDPRESDTSPVDVKAPPRAGDRASAVTTEPRGRTLLWLVALLLALETGIRWRRLATTGAAGDAD